MKIDKLSIIIPAFNEEKTIAKTLKRILEIKIPGITKELIVVNDGSKDKTLQAIKGVKDKKIKIIDKKKNEGKGAGIKDALKKVTGDVIIIQDADLEYNPDEIVKLIIPIQEDRADVVYGSRFMGGEAHRVLLFWHMIGNKLLTLLSNMVTNINLTDMETCYKMFTRSVADKLKLEENRFGFEPEFTIKIAKMKARIYEMGISYSGRSYSEGKKINWKDGIHAVWCIIYYGLLD
jgi:glycosyltransferase involved in cell wall biosynthesis